MPTRELIHLSFGSLPAHFSTHHFNAQTGYFDYSPHAPQPLLDHDVSWQEGIDGTGAQRYTPRWLVFDVRSGFEGLRRHEVSDHHAAGDDDDDDDDDDDVDQMTAGDSSSWLSAPQVVRTQGRVPQTPFQRIAKKERRGQELDWEQELEAVMASDEEQETAECDDDIIEGAAPKSASTGASTVQGRATSSSRPSTQRRTKPWSSRLVFESHPRSLVPVMAAGGLPLESMPSSSEAASYEGVEVFESFEQGWARAKAWDRENDTLDTSFRSLLEASDHPQGFNVALQSSDAWGGFSAWHLEELADEYPKLDRLTWAMRWGKGIGDVAPREGGDLDEAELRLARIRAMNESLCLLLLTETSSLYTPLALPEWPLGGATPAWTQHLRQDRRVRIQNDEDYASVLLASQFETATLGMRLRDAPISASSLVSHLTWRGDTPIACLGGCLPTPLLAPLQASTSRECFDPIEALLAARGYNPRPNEDRKRHMARFDPAEVAGTGAKAIVQHWASYSGARSVELQYSKSRSGKLAGSGVSKRNSFVKPYAVHSVARDEQEGAKAITEASLNEYLTGNGEGKLGMEEPWGRSFFAPLAQPVPPSFPRILQGLSADGRPFPPSASAPTQRPRPRSLPQLSTLSTTPSSLSHIQHAHRILTTALRSHAPLFAYGLTAPGGTGASGAGQAANEEGEGRIGGRDGLKELLERVEELRGAYEVERGSNGGDLSGDKEDEGQGTDEDWEATEQADGHDDELDWN